MVSIPISFKLAAVLGPTPRNSVTRAVAFAMLFDISSPFRIGNCDKKRISRREILFEERPNRLTHSAEMR